MAQVHRLIVAPPQDSIRLDVFLASSGLVSRRKARDLLAAGSVYLNRHRVKVASRLVRTGNQVELHLTETPRDVLPIEVPFLFRDDAIVVVNKPAGMPVQPTRETDRGTVLEAVCHQLEDRTGPRVVHRLDREASGAVVIARTREAAAALSSQMAEHSARRIYLAAVIGDHGPESATLRHFLTDIRPPAPGQPRGPARVWTRDADGAARDDERLAVAQIRRLSIGEGCGFYQVVLETGRTHQIRAQLSHVGMPLVGDTRYGAPPPGDDWPAQRIALHAAVLSILHPTTGRPLTVFAPVPDALQKWLEDRRLWLPWLASAEATDILLTNPMTQERTHGDHQAQPLA